MLEPIATTAGIDLEPFHVIAVVAVAVLVGLIGMGIRRFLQASVDELGYLFREAADHLLGRALGTRALPGPWSCERCRSWNGEAVSRCYACGAHRSEAEAQFPDADVPVGPSAGLAQRRRSGH